MKDKIREICYDLEIGCIDWTEASEQLFVLCSVSQQRELLLDFLNNIGRHDYETKTFKQIVDDYLKSNNCG